MASVAERVMEEYPMFAFLLKDKEIGSLLRQAVDPNTPWSPQKFQAKLYQSKWFRRRSQAMREYTILKNVDPGEWKRRFGSHLTGTRSIANQLGFKLTSAEQKYIAASAMQRGIEVGSDEFNYNLYQFIRRQSPSRMVSGAIQTAQRSASSIAKGQYYINLPKSDARRWGIAMALGQKTQEDYLSYIQGRAISKYSHLSAALSSGKTMEDLFSGHKQVLAEELELDPDSIDLSNSRWTKFIDHYDNELKKHRPYTLSEVRREARRDPRFWNTANGKSMSAGLGSYLLNTFGKVA